MIPAPFDYVRAGSVDEAVAALAEHGDEAKLLAGGHSLLPLMKLRLATPAVLVDVGRIGDLSYIHDRGDSVAVGALTNHHDLQCGYCTPGMVLAAVSLLREHPQPTETEVREGLEGNLCRCTGYHNIVQAVLAAAGGRAEVDA